MACTTSSPLPTPSSTEVGSPSQSPSVSPVSSCVLPSDPNSHVYNPDRLKVLSSCISVTGTIDFIRHEADGDYHIGLKVDSQYSNLPNACNSTCAGGAEHGDLVVEPVCMDAPVQPDAISSCVGYHNTIVIPPVGSHVEMTGAYVLDQVHGWTELHPLVEVHVI